MREAAGRADASFAASTLVTLVSLRMAGSSKCAQAVERPGEAADEKQAADPALAGLNQLKFSVWISRGAGLALGVDGLLLMIPGALSRFREEGRGADERDQSFATRCASSVLLSPGSSLSTRTSGSIDRSPIVCSSGPSFTLPLIVSRDSRQERQELIPQMST